MTVIQKGVRWFPEEGLRADPSFKISWLQVFADPPPFVAGLVFPGLGLTLKQALQRGGKVGYETLQPSVLPV